MWTNEEYVVCWKNILLSCGHATKCSLAVTSWSCASKYLWELISKFIDRELTTARHSIFLSLVMVTLSNSLIRFKPFTFTRLGISYIDSRYWYWMTHTIKVVPIACLDLDHIYIVLFKCRLWDVFAKTCQGQIFLTRCQILCSMRLHCVSKTVMPRRMH